MESSSVPYAASAAVGTTTTMVILPQWVVNLHNFRTSLFLKTIEPIIVYLFGPVEDEPLIPLSQLHASTSTPTFEKIANMEDHRRRLGFLPNYVEDASSFKETSMSFATLAMMFTIMTCVLLIFLSCFYHNQKTAPLFASPRRHRLPKLVPPPLPVDGTFSWIKVCFYMSDEEVRYRYLTFNQ